MNPKMTMWLTEELTFRFEGRVLTVDAGTSNRWGRVMARGQAAGRPVSPMDAFIAATAEQHDLALVTRNGPDFAGLGIRLVNPFLHGAG